MSVYNFHPVAFFGGSIGASEWLVMFIVVLVVVGPRKLPELARKFGRTMEMFRRAADEFKEQLLNMDRDINDTVTTAAGSVDHSDVVGDEDADQAYGDSYDYDSGSYDEDSAYPGNEDMVSEWDAHTTDDNNADASETSEPKIESAAEAEIAVKKSEDKHSVEKQEYELPGSMEERA